MEHQEKEDAERWEMKLDSPLPPSIAMNEMSDEDVSTISESDI